MRISARARWLPFLVAILATYSNHFHNSFHFYYAHSIENNAAIREIGNIPSFFRDATTFSSLPSNQSYRPLVSTLLAIDYWLGHGLNPFWFHLSIFAMFVALVLLLAFFIYRLIDNRWIALGAAAFYGLHPANADTVNYIIASSEVISTLGIIGSFAVYLRFPELRRYCIYLLPAAAAVLAKPTAAIFPVLFAFYRILLEPTETRPTRTPLQRMRVAEVAAPFLFCAAVLLFVGAMTPHSWVAGAANVRSYLITQPYVMMLYFKMFFWPSGLSADYDLSPFTTTDDPRFWAGFVFIFFFCAIMIALAVFKRARVIGFGLIWFLVTLLMTSLFPLAEVMNDHRTFLPYIGLIIAVAGAAALVCRGSNLLPDGRQRFPLQSGDSRERASPKIIAACGLALLILCASAFATFQRNKVWKSEETLWRDVTIKSPRNGRGLMNYGNTLMAKGDFAGALDYYHRAQQFTPNYSVLMINLAIAENATNQKNLAEQHFKDALRLAPSNPDSYTYYARYLIAHSRGAEARALLQHALELSPTDIAARELVSQTNNQPGNSPQTPEAYLNLSLQLYLAGRYNESIAASRRALELRPGYAEAWNNIGAAYNKLGRYEDAATACEWALRDKPDFELARNNLQYARERMSRPANQANQRE